MLQSSAELHRYELYKSTGDSSNDDDAHLEFAGLIHHSLTVHKAEDVTAGVDSALEQLRSNMAAISEFKEANKYASPVTLRLPLPLGLLSRDLSTLAARRSHHVMATILCTSGLTMLAAGQLLPTPRQDTPQPIVASLRQASSHRTLHPRPC
jgi:hypothetical protein